MSYDKILLPVSGKLNGERTLKALAHAKKLVKKEIILMHSYEPLPKLIGGQSHKDLIQESYDAGLAILKPFMTKLEQAKISYRICIVEGHPAEAIIHVNLEEKCDLIVMYTDGEDSFKDFLLGTITEHVLRNTSTNLLAIRI